MLPAVARGHDNPHASASANAAAPAHAERNAAPARAPHYAAPARAAAPVHYQAPVRYAAPARVTHYAAPVHYAAPPRASHYTAPVHYQASKQYAAPVHATHHAAPSHYTAPTRATAPVHHRAPVHYATPARVTHHAAPAHFAAPARREHAAAPAPFVQRVAPQRTTHQARATTTAPFVQYVRTAPHVQHERSTRTVIAPRLERSVYASRGHAIPVVYHPRYVVGRVARVRSNEVVIDPPAGTPIVVRDVIIGAAAPAIPVGTYVTLPVTYTNGYYAYAPPAYGGYNYDYGYAPQYDYAYAPPIYCNGNSSTALYAALLPAVVGILTGNGSSFSSNDLTSLALGTAAGANNCVAYTPGGYYTPGYAAPIDYGYNAPAVTQAVPYYAPSVYATPYDNCLAGDEDGDEMCAPATGYTYDNYSAYGAYAPQQVQGVVIGRTGDLLMVLGASGTPTYVYAAPALQSGYAINGPIQPGQIIDAYGYYSGNTFIATALV
jgi:hypothetical protein